MLGVLYVAGHANKIGKTPCICVYHLSKNNISKVNYIFIKDTNV